MRYTLRIGVLEIEYANDEDEPKINLSARGESHPDAPAFGEPTDNENQRRPSYSSWSNFAMYAGLYELFFGVNEKEEQTRDDALIQEHPGCVPLTERHRREINAALTAWKEKYPNATPTYGKPVPDNLNATDKIRWVDSDNPRENWEMTRLVWLHYWVNWALDNCKQPVFENS